MHFPRNWDFEKNVSNPNADRAVAVGPKCFFSRKSMMRDELGKKGAKREGRAGGASMYDNYI